MLKMKITNEVKPLKLKATAKFPAVILAKLQEKNAIPTKNEQEIIPDKNYDGLSKVIVNKIPDEYIVPSGSTSIIENGSYDVTEYANVNVNVPEKQLGTKTITTNGTYKASDDNLDGYSEVEVTTSGGSTFEINDAEYLFYNGARTDNLNQYLKACKNINSTYQMFGSCKYLTSLDLSDLNTDNVRNMSYMFSYCQKLITLDLSVLNTDNVTNMSSLLNQCWDLENLNLNGINTINVTAMNYMFSSCQKLKSLDLSAFYTNNVTTMNNMFSGCYELSEINLSSFNTSNLKDIAYMFSNCYKLISLDLSAFDTNNVTNTNYMFNNSGIEKLIINRQDVFKMTNINMFNNTPIANGTGYVYVPDNMVETYKSATNWSNYADQIKPTSELEVA